MEKIKCKSCDFESGSFFRTWYHIVKTHKINPTKGDFKFLAKYCHCGQAIRLTFGIVKILLILIVLLVTYPFWWLNEKMSDIL